MAEDRTLRPVEPAPDAKPTTAYTVQRAADAIDRIETALGGRPALVDALLHVPPSARLDYVVGLIADPRHDARRLSELCRAGAVTIGELLEAFKRGRLATAQAEAIAQVAAAIPAVAADLATRALPHTIDCPICDGTGTIPAEDDKPPVPCRACRGTGQRRQQPSLDTQREVLGLVGLGSKAGSGPSVVIDQRDQRAVTIHDHSPEGHSRLLAAVDRLLHGGRVAARPDVPYTADAPGDDASPAADGSVVDAERDPGDVGDADAR